MAPFWKAKRNQKEASDKGAPFLRQVQTLGARCVSDSSLQNILTSLPLQELSGVLISLGGSQMKFSRVGNYSPHPDGPYSKHVSETHKERRGHTIIAVTFPYRMAPHILFRIGVLSSTLAL